MANEIVFVGAGPLGLWTAIQVKLQRPDLDIVFKEKKEIYTRTHTLLLKPGSLDGCVKDQSGVIEGIISDLKANPHIRTNELENRLKILARELGIRIDQCNVENVKRDILQEYPQAALIIGSDGVRSKLRKEIFGDENVERMPLAYAAQIKYSVQGEALRENQLLDTYPRLKHSNYLASLNVGKISEGKTPVTIQLFIDQATYDQIRDKTTYANPLRLLADSLEDQLPPELLNDIKTHLGFRLSNGENIIIDDINLTTTELPQQRCHHITILKDGHYYAVIGDAALALSFFKGMNKGLMLATEFSKNIVANWDNIVAKDEAVFQEYEQHYQRFATAAFASGHKTEGLLRKAFSAIHAGAALPFQFIYFNDNTIADFHRCFDVIHQASQFYLDAKLHQSEGVTVVAGAEDIKSWLNEQLPDGLLMLKDKLVRLSEAHQAHEELHQALTDLANIDTTTLSFYEKVNLALAFSKTSTLLQKPTHENYQACVKFVACLKMVSSSFALIVSSLLEFIAGAIAVAAGIGLMVSSGGAAVGYAAPLIGVGVILAVHGLYKFNQHTQGSSAVYNALDKVITARGNLIDGPFLKEPVEVEIDHDQAGALEVSQVDSPTLI